MKNCFVKILAAGLAALALVSCQPTGEGAGTTTTAEGSVTTGTPETTQKTPSEGVDVMKFELSNYVTLGDYKSEPLTHNVYCSDEELSEQLISYMKESGAYKKVTDRVTAAGDTLNISYAGRVEDIYFEGGTSDSATVELVENNGYIAGFADDLYGVMPGTKVETNVTFPSDYGAEALAGVSAVFEITVNYIMDYTPTDALIEEITNGEFKTLAEFSENYRKTIIKENLKNYEDDVYAAVIDRVFDKCSVISYPDELVGFYREMLEESYPSAAAEDILELAREYAKEDLILHAVFVAEGLTLSEADYRMKLSELASEYGYSSGDVMEAQNGEFNIKNVIRKNMCIEHLAVTINISTDYEQYEHLLSENETTGEVTE
ncbi:MAG: hypothetical protein E7640_03375 [Ruminococcaceae bacterium]|nr:hypothetical protein [Oscillospiraceae bacterium]